KTYGYKLIVLSLRYRYDFRTYKSSRSKMTKKFKRKTTTIIFPNVKIQRIIIIKAYELSRLKPF
ncbi:hypothetical protein, partial [Bacteroides caecimuris]|uniref:hypothetical protein n=1 Tax=Bacteroides caecimuris TaxID=1796613 RepID=UPI0026E51BCB